MDDPLTGFLTGFPANTFEVDSVLIDNTFRQRDSPSHEGRVAYIHEGLVKGAWRRSIIAPEHHAVAIVAGDGRWIGADAFKFGENLFRYTTLVTTTATIVPACVILEQAPRNLLLAVLKSISLDWCTAASVASLPSADLRRRVLLLLFDVGRLHPRPEIEIRQQDLADLVGVSRQTLNPVLKELESQGLISIGYREILIADPSRLDRALRAPAE